MEGTRYNVGGVLTSIPRAYLNRTALAQDTSPDPHSFQFSSYTSGPIKARFPYEASRGLRKEDVTWPPRGIHLKLIFRLVFT